MMAMMHTSTLWAFILMALVCLVLRALWKPEKLRGWTLPNPWLHRLWQRMLQPAQVPLTLALALAGLAAVQLAWVAAHFLETVPLEATTASNPLLEALRSEGNTVRCSLAPDDPLLNSLMLNQLTSMNVSCLNVSAASRIPNDLNTFFETLGNDQAKLWFLAGVKNVAVPEQTLAQMRQDPGVGPNIDHADGYTLELTSSPDLPSHALVTMKNYLAKATLVPDAEFFATEEAMLDRLKDPTWNPRESVLLLQPGTSSPPSPAGPPESFGDVVLETYTPTEIEIEAQSSRGGFILINDQYNPDWQAQVNGRDVPLLRADYILRAVAIPAGQSRITLHYFAQYRLPGLSLPVVAVNNFSDAAMLAAWLVAGFALLRKKATS
jgi:hypothetical protein